MDGHVLRCSKGCNAEMGGGGGTDSPAEPARELGLQVAGESQSVGCSPPGTLLEPLGGPSPNSLLFIHVSTGTRNSGWAAHQSRHTEWDP